MLIAHKLFFYCSSCVFIEIFQIAPIYIKTNYQILGGVLFFYNKKVTYSDRHIKTANYAKLLFLAVTAVKRLRGAAIIFLLLFII